jgi:hypothetical protein
MYRPRANRPPNRYIDDPYYPARRLWENRIHTDSHIPANQHIYTDGYDISYSRAHNYH